MERSQFLRWASVTLGTGVVGCSQVALGGANSAKQGQHYVSGALDGNATFTFVPILQSDMFIAYDGDRSLADQPYFTAFFETPPYSTTRSSNVTSIAGWTSDASGEYVKRQNARIGGVKFGRMTSPPGSIGKGAFLLSSHASDQTLDAREEIVTWGKSVALPHNRDLWIAGRYYLDFPTPPTGTQEFVLIWQLKPDPSTAPALSVSFYGDRVDVIHHFNPTDYLPRNFSGTKERMDKFTHRIPGEGSKWKAKWFDLVIKLNLDPLNAGGGYYKVWFDDTLMHEYIGPIGFGGLTVDGGRRIYNARWSNYPSVIPWTGGKRDVWVQRCFVCKDDHGYTLSQVRQALNS